MFRDQVLNLAARRGVNAADLARSIMLALPEAAVAAADDPGEPAADDRDAVTLKSGPGKGKPWRRKPRLQVRLPAGYDPVLLRKALGLALSLDGGALRVVVERRDQPTRVEETARHLAEAAKLQEAVQALASVHLTHPVRTRDEALFVLGFPPGSRPDVSAIKARYRLLATIHHPDSGIGDTSRMAQLNQAMSFMRGYAKQ